MTDILITPNVMQIAGKVVVDIQRHPYPRMWTYRITTEDNYEWDVTLPLDGPPRVELQLLPWMEAPLVPDTSDHATRQYR